MLLQRRNSKPRRQNVGKTHCRFRFLAWDILLIGFCFSVSWSFLNASSVNRIPNIVTSALGIFPERMASPSAQSRATLVLKFSRKKFKKNNVLVWYHCVCCEEIGFFYIHNNSHQINIVRFEFTTNIAGTKPADLTCTVSWNFV